MTMPLYMFLTMSLAGSLLICIMLIGERLWGRKMPRVWQYYLWIIVIARLLVPGSLMADVPEADALPAVSAVQASGQAQIPADEEASGTVPEAPKAPAYADWLGTVQGDSIGWQSTALNLFALVWLGGALGLMIHRVTAYRSFIRCLRAGMEPLCDEQLLNRTAELAELLHIRRPVEVCINPLASSPMMIGFRRPVIVLPELPGSPDQFECIVLHELVHLRRHDQAYKWAVQTAVCLHWFNPLVYVMSRRIARLCELACDERVMQILGQDGAALYGSTLLDSMGGAHSCRAAAGTLEMSENKRLLKERLEQMGEHTKRKPGAACLALLLAGSLLICAACTRVYVPAGLGRSGAVRVPDTAAGWTADLESAELSVQVDGAWVELLSTDESRLRADYDGNYYTVSMLETDGRMEVWCEGTNARNVRTEHIKLYVPRTADSMYVGLESGMLTGGTEVPVQSIEADESLVQLTLKDAVRQAVIVADNSLLQILSADDFADTEIRMQMNKSLLTTSEELKQHVQRSGSSAALSLGEPDRYMELNVRQGVVLLNAGEKQAEALMEILESWDGEGAGTLPELPELDDFASSDAAEPEQADSGTEYTAPGTVRGILGTVGAGVGDILSAVGDGVRDILRETGSEIRSEIRGELRNALD
ncbi:MAG: hypothetical protein HDQ87_00595 [Clostridia bacterium]|nr:hypothetical protein [Clostridia bacterium]